MKKKLKLNKQTISNLDEKALSNLRGGIGLGALDDSCCGGSYSCSKSAFAGASSGAALVTVEPSAAVCSAIGC
ncbi:class I lanthipeptide [Olivibacter sp. 47]|jgi:natural product precursor|uniref:class I lanthipeptide n=1 Tax=Olivibacter sp. 47 TaxID=3056486 RepID=UPI0025A313B8|nr:class I lanthipeptide [Olivibacter sp. 47]MDM8173474.1 class I lanthipeptide [Olivibacter sp. 47]